MLEVLVLIAIAITYIIPKGMFGTMTDEAGNLVTDYSLYIKLTEQKGINIFKGLFGFILVLFSSVGLYPGIMIPSTEEIKKFCGCTFFGFLVVVLSIFRMRMS